MLTVEMLLVFVLMLLVLVDVSEDRLEMSVVLVAIWSNKHLYFHGERKTFRTRLDRIVALDPYQDGIGVRKQGVTARPQIFVGIDGWFAFNLIKHFGSGEE